MVIETQAVEHPTLPEHANVLFRILMGKNLCYCVSAIARFAIPDLLGEGAASADALAAKTGLNAEALYRVMRVLASVGIFIEHEDRVFSLADGGQILRTDVPGSMRFPAIQFGEPWSARAWEYFPETIRTGQNAVSLAYGMNVFDYFGEHPSQAEIFNRSMANYSEMMGKPIADAYDFSSVRTLVDVGGGNGALLASILRQYGHLQGILYDLPNVVEGALAKHHFSGLECRVVAEGGSFFDRIPGGGDAYIMKSILHDWSDEHCISILSAIREQLPRDGRVLVCEGVIEAGSGPSPAKFLDIEMLAMTVGGRERTVEEYRKLFSRANLQLTQTIPTASPVVVLEAKPR